MIKRYSDFLKTINESAASDLRSELKDLGYAEKSGELSSGGEITSDIEKIVEVVLSEFKKTAPNSNVTITSGNDKFHHQLGYTSRHTKGQAIDLVIDPNSDQNHRAMIDVLTRVSAGTPGFSYIDEYNNPSSAATGGHFHLSYGPKPENPKTANASSPDPIKITGLTGAEAPKSNVEGVVIDADFITRLIDALKSKNFSQKDLKQFSKPEQVQLASAEDEEFYKAILADLGAKETPEKIKFLKAWRQAEGGKAKNNPFNTTRDIPGEEDTIYNSHGVRNYPTRQEGLDATVATLRLPAYKEIVDLLKRDDVTADEIANSQALKTWGTGELIAKVLDGGRVNPPAIA